MTFTALGYLLNFATSPISLLLSFLLCLGLAWQSGINLKDKLWRTLGFIAIIFGLFFIDSLFVLFSWWDAQAYHVPASLMLADGWNPILAADRPELLAFTGLDGTTFNAYHVAYLPRAGWIWSAVLAKLTGNAELGDSLILFTAVTLGALAWRLTPLLFGPGRKKQAFFTSLVVCSPGIIASLFCGAQDGALYALILIQMFAACAYRKTGRKIWLSYLGLVPILGCNLKFTGAITLLLSACIFTIPILWNIWRKQFTGTIFWRWVAIHAAGFLVALIVGFSPYLTNWAKHGGPFYPQHSFNKAEVLPPMTADFDLLNDDAAAMGYVGRLVNAYFSKWLAHRYYEWKLEKKPFRPVFHLDQVSGLGVGFRIIMVLTLIILCFTRRCRTPWFLLALLVTSLLTPTRFVGYVRYVPQFWMFPVLVAFNAITVNTTVSPLFGRVFGLINISILASSTYIFLIGKLIISLGQTEYALSILEAMQTERAPRAYVLSRNDRYQVDGRCLAAWLTLPKDIPSPHPFDYYFHALLPNTGVAHIQWQTVAQMQQLRATGAPYFYLNEHLWYWPRNPQLIRHPEMHYYCGHPKKPFTFFGILNLAPTVLQDFPRYCTRILRLRKQQMRTGLVAKDTW